MNISHFKTEFMAVVVFLATLVVPIEGYGQSKLYVVNQGSNNISVVDTQVGAIVKTIPSPAGAIGTIAYNPANKLMYLATNVNKVYLIDTITDLFTGSPITGTGPNPTSVTISPELSRAYVPTYYGTVAVIDTTANAVIANVATGYLPVGSDFHPALGKAYVVNNGSQTVSVIDVATSTVINTISGMGGQPTDIKIDTVANKAVVTRSDSFALAMVETLTDTVVATLPVPGKPQWVAVDSVKHRAYVTYYPGGLAVVDTVANTIVTTLSLGNNPTRLALDAKENRLYVTDRGTNSVFVVDTTTNTILSPAISVGTDPIDIAIMKDSGFLRFPLKVLCGTAPCTPFTANIASVMDHSGTPLDPINPGPWHSINGKVKSYTGEVGEAIYGTNCTPGPGYKNATETNFIINDNYVGASCPVKAPHDPASNIFPRRFLNYDGHSGYDYPYPVGTPIVAPADGQLFKAAEDNINHNSECKLGKSKFSGWKEWHTFYIVHANGYSTWFLHASELDPVIEAQIADDYTVSVPVIQGQVVGFTGKFGRCKPVGAHLHFEVRKGLHTVVDPYSEKLWIIE